MFRQQLFVTNISDVAPPASCRAVQVEGVKNAVPLTLMHSLEGDSIVLFMIHCL